MLPTTLLVKWCPAPFQFLCLNRTIRQLMQNSATVPTYQTTLLAKFLQWPQPTPKPSLISTPSRSSTLDCNVCPGPGPIVKDARGHHHHQHKEDMWTIWEDPLRPRVWANMLQGCLQGGKTEHLVCWAPNFLCYQPCYDLFMYTIA